MPNNNDKLFAFVPGGKKCLTPQTRGCSFVPVGPHASPVSAAGAGSSLSGTFAAVPAGSAAAGTLRGLRPVLGGTLLR